MDPAFSLFQIFREINLHSFTHQEHWLKLGDVCRPSTFASAGMLTSTTPMLAPASFPGFWRRSLDEFKRLSNIVIKLEALEGPKQDLALWDFANPSNVEACADMSDTDIGGSSTSSLVFVPESTTTSTPAHVRFSGTISNQVPIEDPSIERTGYAAFRTLDRPPTIFGKQLWDVERYRYLALRIKSDGRKYKVNVQTESLEYTDLHQHRLYARRPGNWETVLIKWSDFVRTNHGIVVEPQSEIMTTKVRTIGIGLTDRLPGPFQICVGKIWATNSLVDDKASGSIDVPPVYVPKDIKTAQSPS